MTTSNITISTSWVQIASTADTDMLATFDTTVIMEVATTAANSAPTVQGHKLSSDSAITRSVIGSGYVWAKLVKGSYPSSITLIVSK